MSKKKDAYRTTAGRIVLVAVWSEWSGLYESGDWTYPNWRAATYDRFAERLEGLIEQAHEFTIRLESVGMVQAQMAATKPEVLLLAGTTGYESLLYLQAYIPTIMLTDNAEVRDWKSAGNIASIVRPGLMRLVRDQNGTLSMRRSGPGTALGMTTVEVSEPVPG